MGVKIIACLLLLGSLAALALPWMKLAAEVGPNQTRMSPGELIQNFAGLDAAAVLDSVQSELTAAGVQMDVSALSDLLHRVLDGRFLPHEMGIACRDLSVICRAAHRLDLAGTMETLAYGVWGVFGLLALLGLIALICQLTDHRGGIVPYFLLGALVVSDNLEGVVFLLWGNFARTKKELIDTSRHHVLEAPHPSPLARGAFFGCRHFSRTNEILISEGKTPINWQL